MLDTYLRCEACQAVAFQFLLEFNVAEKYSKSAFGQLSSRTVEMVGNEEGACAPEHFEEHHFRNVNETRYLAGVGMPMAADSSEGYPIPGNCTVPLAIRCVELMREVGMAQLYHAYSTRTLEHVACMEETRQCRE